MNRQRGWWALLFHPKLWYLSLLLVSWMQPSNLSSQRAGALLPAESGDETPAKHSLALAIKLKYDTPSILFEEDGKAAGLSVTIRHPLQNQRCLVVVDLSSPGYASTQDQCFSKLGEVITFLGSERYDLTLNAIDPNGHYAELYAARGGAPHYPSANQTAVYIKIAIVTAIISLLAGALIKLSRNRKGL